MHTVLEFPAKVFDQWGAIAQEIVPYLVQRGVGRDDIPAVLERVRARWAQLVPPLPGDADMPLPDQAANVSRQQEEGELYASRHWRTQSARILIESAGADYQRHARD